LPPATAHLAIAGSSIGTTNGMKVTKPHGLFTIQRLGVSPPKSRQRREKSGHYDENALARRRSMASRSRTQPFGRKIALNRSIKSMPDLYVWMWVK